MAQQQAIRDYLKSRGLKDEEIGYDNGTVLAKGKRFMDATPNEDGRTYADTRTLDNAYNDYDVKDQLAQLRIRATQPNQELTGMQQAIRDRINKPVQQFNYDQNTDPQYQNAINQAKQNAQTAGNNAMVSLGARGIGNSSITTDRVAQIQQKELGNVTANVLPQLISQAYQRYIGQANLEQQQTGNMLQYTDYLDRSGQQQFRNAYDLLGQQNTMTQQDRDNEYRGDVFADKQKQDRIALANYLTTTYGKQVDPKMDSQLAYDQVEGITPLVMQQFLQQKAAQDAGFTGTYNGQDTEQKKSRVFNEGAENRRIGLQAAGQAQSAANAANSNALGWANLSQRDKEAMLRYSSENDPNSLDNQIKKANLTKLTQDNTKKADHGIDEYDLAVVDDLAAKAGIDPVDADPATLRSFVANLKGKYGWDVTEAKSVEDYMLNKGSAQRSAEEQKRSDKQRAAAEQAQNVNDAKSIIYGQNPYLYPWQR